MRRVSPIWGNPGNGRTATPRSRSAKPTFTQSGTGTQTKLACEVSGVKPRVRSATANRSRSVTARAMCSFTHGMSCWSAASAVCSAMAFSLYGPRDFSTSITSAGCPTAYPIRRPARPNAFDMVRMTSRRSKCGTRSTADTPANSAYASSSNTTPGASRSTRSMVSRATTAPVGLLGEQRYNSFGWVASRASTSG